MCCAAVHSCNHSISFWPDEEGSTERLTGVSAFTVNLVDAGQAQGNETLEHLKLLK